MKWNILNISFETASLCQWTATVGDKIYLLYDFGKQGWTAEARKITEKGTQEFLYKTGRRLTAWSAVHCTLRHEAQLS